MKPSRMIRILILISTLWMVFTIFKTQAAERRPVTVKDIVSMKRLADPRISPNGSRVAFVVTETDDEQNINDSDIWFVGTEGGGAYRVTRGPKRDDTPRWSPDGSKIAFLSDRSDKLQIFMIAVGGGEAVALTDHGTGVSSFAWSPDGEHIAFVARVPLSEEEEKKKNERPIVIDTDYLYDRLWKVNVETKEVEPLIDKAVRIRIAILPELYSKKRIIHNRVHQGCAKCVSILKQTVTRILFGLSVKVRHSLPGQDCLTFSKAR